MWAQLRGKRVYLDTNIIIYAIEANPDFHERAKALIEAIDCDEILAVTSELTVAEALVKPIASGRSDIVSQYEAFLLSDSKLRLVAVDRTILRSAADLRARMNIKLPDAIHVASAIETDCEIFLSQDRELRLPGSIRHLTTDDA